MQNDSEMKKIATHDSATGERPMWYCWPLAPFAMTQSKTIEEQYNAGCRLFDLRLRWHRGRMRLAHGWYIIRRDINDVLRFLSEKGDCHVTITYEGFAGKERRRYFIWLVRRLKYVYPNIGYGPAAIKKGKGSTLVKTKYEYVLPADKDWLDAPSRSHFVKLDGSNLCWLLPFPWLWKKLRFNKPDFRDDCYTYVDFL